METDGGVERGPQRRPDEPRQLSDGPVPGATSSPAGRRPTLRFFVAGLLSVLGFWGIYATFVLTASGQRFENLSLEGATLRSASDREASLENLSVVSLAPFAVAILLVFLIALGRRRFALGTSTAIAMSGSVVVAELLKAFLPRPGLVDGPAWILRNSFPSGSATVAAAVGVGIMLVTPDRLRWVALTAAASLAAVIAQATQITGWHRMSDVLGGVLLATTAASLAVIVLSKADLISASTHTGVDRRVTGTLVLAGVGAVLLGAVILGISYAFPVLATPSGSTGAFVHTTLDLVGSGVTILILVGFGRVIEPYTIGSADTLRDRSAPAPDARTG